MATLPAPLPSAKMAAVEKRRPAMVPAASFPDGGRPAVSRAAATAESEEDFLRQVGVTDMLRAALLKVLEARPEEPIAFLAHYFENMGLRSPASGGAGEPPGQLLLQQQRLGRALWHLRLAHHSQRCGTPGRAAGDYNSRRALRGPPVSAREARAASGLERAAFWERRSTGLRVAGLLGTAVHTDCPRRSCRVPCHSGYLCPRAVLYAHRLREL